jgi:CTP:phosphocholine cytidylyltransferase-like protein
MENAILMASGMGTRMRPLTERTPKPLIKVGNSPMIETIINGLENRGVDSIAVVVGYLEDQFYYLEEKYHNVSLVKNKVFETVNNISSVYAARDVLLKGNCFVCEADLYVADAAIFEASLERSCYYGKMMKGHSDDWVFDQNENGIITRIGRGGDDQYNMTGIAYFTADDAKLLHQVIEEEYGKTGYETLFWDDAVNKHIKEFKLTVYPVNRDQIIEIDTIQELMEVQKSIVEWK